MENAHVRLQHPRNRRPRTWRRRSRSRRRVDTVRRTHSECMIHALPDRRPPSPVSPVGRLSSGSTTWSSPLPYTVLTPPAHPKAPEIIRPPPAHTASTQTSSVNSLDYRSRGWETSPHVAVSIEHRPTPPAAHGAAVGERATKGPVYTERMSMKLHYSDEGTYLDCVDIVPQMNFRAETEI